MPSDIPPLGPCAVCGRPATDRHHVLPRGRTGGTGLPMDAGPDEEPMLVPVCRACHRRLEPEGRWRIKREGDYWVTLDIQNGEMVCRRPVLADQSRALALLESIGGLVDQRDKDRRLLTLASLATDDEVLMLAECGSRMKVGGAAVQVVAHYEAWARYPWKGRPHWAERLANVFRCSAKTIYEDVAAGRLYADDLGPPLPASWYRQAAHAADPEAAVRLGHEIHEAGGTITMFRKALGLPSANRQMHACPLCGRWHVIQEE